MYTKSKPRKKTRNDCKRHFLRRAKERGLDIIDAPLYNIICDTIRAGKDFQFIKFITKQSNSRSIYLLEHKGENFYLIWDKNVHTFSTVLTQEMVDQWDLV